MAVGDRYFLVFDSGEKTEVTYDAVVGRSSSCEIEVDDATVSRQHARFLISDEGLSLIDLDSRNGTFANDVKIVKSKLLHPGESIRFGSFSCSLECEQESVVMPDQDATIVRPTVVPQESEDKPADQGSILVMPRFENLPPAWVYNDDDDRTSFLSAADMQKLAQEQEKISLDLSVFESSIDAPTLVIATGNEAGTPYKLQKSTEDSFWTIGRGSENLEVSIVIDDVSVSTVHAKLSYKGGRWKMADQMSTNKTYINGEQFNSAFLSSKDVVRLGSVSLLFLLPANSEKEQVSAQTKTGLWGQVKRFFKI